ncbi:hypothetical protein [Bosea sp. (in: a-proteobacteria)]|uniref:hypothetical protein n=1 Tax=Bosea sp. (in: a-proteobacteria) TaxID=1871050 RepID=UPI0026166DFA|nr:hypothetical protein [Bosea sp. (in: a-proteobacteria)]MCO5090446.1 hypothetical protein [Bosea sp. (in: a-proteobacteria)]
MSELHSVSGRARPAQQAYVIELGEAQIGLVNRRADERDFTFVSACAAFRSLDGRRFATPIAAEAAARRLAGRPRRRSARLDS